VSQTGGGASWIWLDIHERETAGLGHGRRGRKGSKYLIYLRPQQDSNLRTRLRRPLLYPLSYGGWRISEPTHHSRRPDQQYQERGSPDTQLICTHQLARADTLAP
jgi:hypothetical protein